MAPPGSLALVAGEHGHFRCIESRTVASYGRLALALMFVPRGTRDEFSAVVDFLENISGYIEQPPRVVKIDMEDKGRVSSFTHGCMVQGQDDAFYAAPKHANWVFMYDPWSDSSAAINLPMEIWERDNIKWKGALCEGPDQNLYSAPCGSEVILRVRPGKEAVDVIELPENALMGCGECAWVAGMTLASDGCLYCPPSGARGVLRLDPRGDQVEILELPSDPELHFGGSMLEWCDDDIFRVMSSDMYLHEFVEYEGVLFAAPWEAPFVLAVDTARRQCIPLEPYDGWEVPQTDTGKWCGTLQLYMDATGSKHLACMPGPNSLRGILSIDCNRAVSQIRDGFNVCRGCVREILQCYEPGSILPALTGSSDISTEGSMRSVSGGRVCIGITSSNRGQGIVLLDWNKHPTFHLLNATWITSAPIYGGGDLVYLRGGCCDNVQNGGRIIETVLIQFDLRTGESFPMQVEPKCLEGHPVIHDGGTIYVFNLGFRGHMHLCEGMAMMSQ